MELKQKGKNVQNSQRINKFGCRNKNNPKFKLKKGGERADVGWGVGGGGVTRKWDIMGCELV